MITCAHGDGNIYASGGSLRCFRCEREAAGEQAQMLPRIDDPDDYVDFIRELPRGDAAWWGGW